MTGGVKEIYFLGQNVNAYHGLDEKGQASSLSKLIEEVAKISAWIVSPECTFTTGFLFDISGGRATY